MPGDAKKSLIDGESWAAFCRELEAAGRLVLEGSPQADPVDRAEGFRLLTRLARGALEQFVEHDDPERPQWFANSHETLKVIAENPDNLYRYARVDPRHTYRLRGTRGGSDWMSFNIHGGAFASGGGAEGRKGALTHKQMHFDEDGRFELWISRERRAGNWLELDPAASHLLVRQTFSDPEKKRPSELELERIGAAQRPAAIDPAKLHEQLLGAAGYVSGVTRIAIDWVRRSSSRPNVFVDVEPGNSSSYKDPEITFHQAYFELQPGEALVVEAMPPACDYWMFVLHNVWLESLDYRYHPVILNSATARLEPDGSVRLIVADEDPGWPNWLDTAGHRRGTLGLRWVGTGVRDVLPSTRLTTLVALREAAPRRV